MEITQEKIDLIKKIIKNDRKFSGNEDLLDDFLNETCKRSVSIVNSIDNASTLEAYLRKVVSTSIMSVLKDLGRLRRTKSGYIPTEEVSIEAVAPFEDVTSAPQPNSAIYNIDYSTIQVGYGGVKVPVNPEDSAIHNEIIEFVSDTIEKIDSKYPDERFLDIFLMRYNNGLTQREISQELGISQSEVSKRIYGLIEKVKDVLNEQ